MSRDRDPENPISDQEMEQSLGRWGRVVTNGKPRGKGREEEGEEEPEGKDKTSKRDRRQQRIGRETEGEPEMTNTQPPASVSTAPVFPAFSSGPEDHFTIFFGHRPHADEFVGAALLLIENELADPEFPGIGSWLTNAELPHVRIVGSSRNETGRAMELADAGKAVILGRLPYRPEPGPHPNFIDEHGGQELKQCVATLVAERIGIYRDDRKSYCWEKILQQVKQLDHTGRATPVGAAQVTSFMEQWGEDLYEDENAHDIWDDLPNQQKQKNLEAMLDRAVHQIQRKLAKRARNLRFDVNANHDIELIRLQGRKEPVRIIFLTDAPEGTHNAARLNGLDLVVNRTTGESGSRVAILRNIARNFPTEIMENLAALLAEEECSQRRIPTGGLKALKDVFGDKFPAREFWHLDLRTHNLLGGTEPTILTLENIKHSIRVACDPARMQKWEGLVTASQRLATPA